jgi:peptidoglycan/LPS O-acetylase OafA/YrhL
VLSRSQDRHEQTRVVPAINLKLALTFALVCVVEASPIYLSSMEVMVTALNSVEPPLPSRSGESPQQAHYNFLDGLRGLAACYVMIYHFTAYVPARLPRGITHLEAPLSFGHLAVSVFIVLSGFSLMLPVVASGDHRLRGGFGGYIKRRCKRILPAYFPALLFSILVTWLTANIGVTDKPDHLTWPDIATHLLLIHNLSPTYAHTINIAHWSVAAECQIYLVFALILLPWWRWAGNTATLLLAFLLSAIPMLLLPREHDLSWTCPWYIGLFAIGMVAATVRHELLTARLATILGVLIIALAAAYFLFHRYLFSPADHDFHKVTFVTDTIAGSIVACGLLIGLSHSLRRVRVPFFHLLETRPLRFLGSISYSLYLLHAAVLAICLWTAQRLSLDALHSLLLRVMAGTTVSLILAAISARYFEKPLLRSTPISAAP